MYTQCRSYKKRDPPGNPRLRSPSLLNQLIGLVARVLTNGPGNLGPGRVFKSLLKMVLDSSLLNTQQYKIRIKGKVEKSREKSSAPPTPQCCSYGKRAFWSTSTTVANALYI